MDDITKLTHGRELAAYQYPKLPQDLSTRERIFFRSYFEHPDYDRAIAKAGYDCSKRTASDVVSGLNRKPAFRATLTAFHTQLDAYIKAKVQAAPLAMSEFYTELPLHLLSEKQRKFVLTFAGDIRAALVAADLSPSKQNQLRVMGVPAVRTCINRIREYMDEGLLMKKQDILARIEDLVDDDTSPPAVKLKALDMLAQYQGMKTEKIIVDKYERKETVHVNINVDLDDPTNVITVPVGGKVRTLT